jgi:hypothetical protein
MVSGKKPARKTGGDAVSIVKALMFVFQFLMENCKLSIFIQQEHKHQLTDKSALFVAIWIQNLKHILCSNKRSREFIQVLYCFKRLHMFAPLGFGYFLRKIAKHS